jgi:murein L,D-transpeptidase YafK
MHAMLRRLLALVALIVLTATLSACGGIVANDNRQNVPLSSSAKTKLASMGSSPGEAMMIRIFKETSELEVWKQTAAGPYKLFGTYAICSWSGGLGPKIKEGDRQSPEGFYTITPGLLNPRSHYYLAFNTGFPNKFDRAWGRTGSNLMVHGDCSSSGCYAMTDAQIKEIYALARESFAGGNRSFQLEIYPFRMTPGNLAKHADDPNMAFWQNLKDGYDRFELTHRPPSWDVCARKYVFDVPEGMTLDAAGACPPGAIVRTAALEARQSADAKAMQAAVASFAAKAAKAAAEAEQAASEKAAIAARGQAIGGLVSGVFGGGNASAAAPAGVEAPIPMPRKQRG